MKLVVAYLPPDQLQDVIDALSAHHVANLMISPARNLGQEHAHTGRDQRDYLGITLTRRVRLEIGCADDEVDGILEAIRQGAHASSPHGAAVAMVLPIERLLRFRAGEPGAGGVPSTQ
jgi:nitrogen regulatory protein PII